jgi:hypothetical protein
MWGCTRWPDCDWAKDIDPAGEPSGAEEVPFQPGLPGAYAQERMERERTRARLKQRALLPLATCIALIVMGGTFLSVQIAVGSTPAAVVALLAALAFIVGIFRLPLESLFWSKGVEGERRTAAFIEPLIADGYLVLYNRLLPIGRGDIDSLLVGPTGIFVIETKNWGKAVEVKGHRLFAGESDRTWVIEQTYREALAVQLALSDELTALRITVASIICVPGGIRGGRRVVSGVTLSTGKDLARLIKERPDVLDSEAVDRLARLAHKRLRQPMPWEADSHPGISG